MTTLFLDFDGVLHPDCVYQIRGKIVLNRDCMSLFEWAPILVELLAPYPEIRIVLSTSWVRVLGYDEALGWLPEDLRVRVDGATCTAGREGEWERLSRFEQIARAASAAGYARWLALEDDVQHWPASHLEHLVACDPDLGLGWKRTQDALRERLPWLAAGGTD